MCTGQTGTAFPVAEGPQEGHPTRGGGRPEVSRNVAGPLLSENEQAVAIGLDRSSVAATHGGVGSRPAEIRR